jgi:hypothetical protein
MASNRLTRSTKKEPWYARWRFTLPVAATHPTWVRIERYIKTNHPIVFFFQYTAPRVFRRQLHKLSRLKWGILHRTIHRFHVINTGLTPGYYDSDVRMLHACFALLTDYMETKFRGLTPHEMAPKVKEWADDAGNSYPNEIYDLYFWWTVERPARLSISDLTDDRGDFLDQDQFHHDQDDGMLIRLMKIRRYLW